ncbi:ester cyclase [Amycolatopsis sp. YIM 10]|uniref:ester cyclase n=1 Tax=Amycolatopsis sp. YIM 10 TaxID=2653857 RepID=UPI0012906189|nr:ester cyclase [Amycolatopsis sp. YIM 10]QFU90560.1 SnoaL-like polyketide cyclase [Amycolatopsis sp. YIM 10]
MTTTAGVADLIGAFYRDVHNGRNPDRAADYLAAGYRSHHPAADGSLDGFRRTRTALLGDFPDLDARVDHLLVQNDRAMVFAHWTGTHRDHGPLRMGTADLYRVSGDRITEHWGVVDYSALLRMGMPVTDQARQPGEPPDWRCGRAEREALRLVIRVWEEVMTQHRLELTERYYRQDYIQHNEYAARSGAGLAGMKQFFAGLFQLAPDFSSQIKQLVVDGDKVGLFATWRGREASSGRELALATADVLRIEDGLIAEHWDVMDFAAVAKFGVG